MKDEEKQMTSPQRDRRFSIGLPPWHEKRLIWWSLCKKVKKTQLAQNTLQARIEANAEHIEQMLQELATDSRMTLTELKRKALEEANFTLLDDDDKLEGE